MSLNEIKKTIENFISQDNNDAIAINGKYGVGKTYYWRQLIEKASEKKPFFQSFTSGYGKDRKIGKPYYAYVSVFGVDSLDALKISIFTETVRAKEINSLSNRSDKIARTVGAKIQNIPGIQKVTGDLLSSIAFQGVNNALICIDDIDRKSPKLAISEIIGLANLLKEQHNCKIVLILNEERLKSDELLDEYKKYRKEIEKLIDFEIQFAPNSEEVLKYVFEESLIINSVIKENIEFIKHNCRLLEIENIRTLQKIRRYVEELSQYLKNLESEVVQSILKSLILFVWCIYDNEHIAPPLEFIENYSIASLYIKKEYKKEEVSNEEKKYSGILSAYGFTSVSEIDKILMSFVKRGFLNSEEFKKQIKVKNNSIIQQQGEKRYGQAWKLYNESFNCNQEEFVEKLFLEFRSNMNYLDIRNLDTTVSILRRLDRNDYANTLVSEFIDKCFNKEAISNMRRGHTDYTNIQDADLKQKLRERVDNFQEKKNTKEVLDNFLQSSISFYEDINYLATLDVDDFYDYFKSYNTDKSVNEASYYKRELYYKVKDFLVYLDGDEPFKTVGLKTKEAIIKIALDCEINKLRILNWFTKEISEDEIEQARANLD